MPSLAPLPIANAPAPAVPRRVSTFSRIKPWLPTIVCAALLAGMIVPGLAYRRWVWNFTELGRYKYDINRNYNFGKNANDGGFLNLYDDQLRDDPPEALKMDYPPLRLATFQAWVAWTRWKYPGVQKWSPDYAFNSFLMNYNASLEALAALAAFLIVRYWLRQCEQANAPPQLLADSRNVHPSTGILRATIAFTLLWFDPGIAIIAHGWPSPNMWVIPFYLWTVLLCLWNFWFIAGIVMGIGAMMQGQQLLVAAVFILWPLLAGKPLRALRWLSGFTLTFMLIASGWMLTRRPDIHLPARQINWPATLWVISSIALLAFVGLRHKLADRMPRKCLITVAVVAALDLVWPTIISGNAAIVAAGSVIAFSIVLLFCRTPWPIARYLLALMAGACLLLCIPFFGASTSWWQIGFVYGTERFQNVGGQLANNLPTILQTLFGWREIHDIAFAIPRNKLLGWPAAPMPVNVRQLLTTIFLIMLTATAAGIARLHRRPDRNLLVALTTPWVLFYTILPQMSPRYAVFAAGVGAICIGQSMGMSLLALFFSALTVEQASLCMMIGNGVHNDASVNPLFNTQMRKIFLRVNSGASWAEVLAALVFVYVAFSRSNHRPRIQRLRLHSTSDAADGAKNKPRIIKVSFTIFCLCKWAPVLILGEKGVCMRHNLQKTIAVFLTLSLLLLGRPAAGAAEDATGGSSAVHVRYASGKTETDVLKKGAQYLRNEDCAFQSYPDEIEGLTFTRRARGPDSDITIDATNGTAVYLILNRGGGAARPRNAAVDLGWTKIGEAHLVGPSGDIVWIYKCEISGEKSVFIPGGGVFGIGVAAKNLVVDTNDNSGKKNPDAPSETAATTLHIDSVPDTSPISGPSAHPTNSQATINALEVYEMDHGMMLGQTSEATLTLTPSETPKLTTVRFVTKVGDQMSLARDEALRYIRLTYPNWFVSSAEITFEDKYVAHDGGSIGTAIGTMILSCIQGFTIDPKVAITGDISANGKVRAIGGVSAKIKGATASKCTLVAIPVDNLDQLVDAVTYNGAQIVSDIQVIGIANLEDAVAVVRTDRDAKLSKAIDLFADVQRTLKGKPADVKSKEIQDKLAQVLLLVPNGLPHEWWARQGPDYTFRAKESRCSIDVTRSSSGNRPSTWSSSRDGRYAPSRGTWACRTARCSNGCGNGDGPSRSKSITVRRCRKILPR